MSSVIAMDLVTFVVLLRVVTHCWQLLYTPCRVWRGGGEFYSIFFCSSSLNAVVKEVLKSVPIYQSYLKNKTGIIFYCPQCIYCSISSILYIRCTKKADKTKTIRCNSEIRRNCFEQVSSHRCQWFDVLPK